MKGVSDMVPIWRVICLVCIGFIAGYIAGDPDKKKYFN